MAGWTFVEAESFTIENARSCRIVPSLGVVCQLTFAVEEGLAVFFGGVVQRESLLISKACTTQPPFALEGYTEVAPHRCVVSSYFDGNVQHPCRIACSPSSKPGGRGLPTSNQRIQAGKLQRRRPQEPAPWMSDKNEPPQPTRPNKVHRNR